MSRAHSADTLLLVTETGSASITLLQSILDIPCLELLVARPLGYRSRPVVFADILLFDYDCMTIECMHQWQTLIPSETRQAILNVGDIKKMKDTDFLLHLPVEGIFYRNDNPEILQNGIRVLLEGEMWMPRNVSAEILAQAIRQSSRATHKETNLSRREKEVARLLATGASNREIAERLFVSLHTVKSHLHNIFRKMDVSSRRQALPLLQQHFGGSALYQ